MKNLFLSAIATLLCCTAANAFDLDDFVLGGVRVHGIPSSQPALDGRYYYQFNSEGTMIKKYSYKKSNIYINNRQFKIYGKIHKSIS